MSRFYAYTRTFGKKDIQTYTQTPHSWTDNKLGSTFWEVLNTDPSRVHAFARGLSLWDAMHPNIGIYPFVAQHTSGNSPHRTFAVDIGGGRGLALLDLRQNLPQLQGRLVLQERQEVLDAISAADLPGVEKMQHDFFTAQPVPGAQIYYIRRVFHDWRDDEARAILENIKPAMASDSRILISDMALPEPVGAEDANAVWLDLMMMTIGGKERTRRDWEGLVASAGLRMVKMWGREEMGPLVVVECALPDGEAGVKWDGDGDGTGVAERGDAVNGLANNGVHGLQIANGNPQNGSAEAAGTG